MTSTFVSLRMPEDLLEVARERAELEDRSLSAVVRQAVRAYVAENSRDQSTDQSEAAR